MQILLDQGPPAPLRVFTSEHQLATPKLIWQPAKLLRFQSKLPLCPWCAVIKLSHFKRFRIFYARTIKLALSYTLNVLLKRNASSFTAAGWPEIIAPA